MNLNNWKIIDAYTRKEAIEDGYQVPIPNGITSDAGIKFPVFMTRTVWDKYVEVSEGMKHQNQYGRLWDILFMFTLQAHKTPDAILQFKFCCQLPDKATGQNTKSLAKEIVFLEKLPFGLK